MDQGITTAVGLAALALLLLAACASPEEKAMRDYRKYVAEQMAARDKQQQEIREAMAKEEAEKLQALQEQQLEPSPPRMSVTTQ